MDYVCRKAIRRLESELMQIIAFMRDNPKSTAFEVDHLNLALRNIVIADTDDFHSGRRTKYVVPKSDFKFKDV